MHSLHRRGLPPSTWKHATIPSIFLKTHSFSPTPPQPQLADVPPHWHSHTWSIWRASRGCVCNGGAAPTPRWSQRPCHSLGTCEGEYLRVGSRKGRRHSGGVTEESTAPSFAWYQRLESWMEHKYDLCINTELKAFLGTEHPFYKEANSLIPSHHSVTHRPHTAQLGTMWAQAGRATRDTNYCFFESPAEVTRGLFKFHHCLITFVHQNLSKSNRRILQIIPESYTDVAYNPFFFPLSHSLLLSILSFLAPASFFILLFCKKQWPHNA